MLPVIWGIKEIAAHGASQTRLLSIAAGLAVPAVARETLSGAVATGSPGLLHAAREAFASGLHAAAWTSAGLMLLAAIVALIRLAPSKLDGPAAERVPVSAAGR
ncbi:hypothetical protein GCM10010168_51010 [Actinoplanes ianthinogenes]|uniref:MFS transporter n=1 Tax=Actinoplanes ianthinogenes TaxID=122358 RepID=A0ABM7M3J2_9ACTN|nr:hypothetical protein [Actinoplanes ianthinogenes]BCJ46152.1 hypothetical protein Aiant_68090 [Actinoplanes ianthinogenes]GGR26625.1 hypothetical protein GCM10010168_51010 [Actinoplanes ianthinogenes]